MNIREEARKIGGDELVARIDAAREVEKTLADKVDALIGEIMDANDGDQMATAAAVCQAMSALMAKSVVFLHELDPKANTKTELLVMTVKSVSANIMAMMDDVAVKKSGVGDLIVAAAKKGGQ